MQVERQLGDLVEEDRGAVGDLEAADLARQGPREGALLPAEQLALDQPRWQRGAIDLHHQVVATGTEAMDGLGDTFLARAGFAADQHRRARRRDLFDLPQDPLDDGALPGDVVVCVGHPDLGLEVVALCLEPVLEPLNLLVRAPEGLLAAAALRDVAENPVGADGAASAVARGGARQMLDPQLAADRVEVAVLDRQAVQPPVMELHCALHHCARGRRGADAPARTATPAGHWSQGGRR